MDNKVVIQLALEDGQYKVGVVNAGNLMREFKRTLDQTAASVKKVEQVQDGMGRKFRDLVLTLGNLRFVAMDINDVFLRLPMAILKTAGEIERLQQLMSGLSKETERAARVAEGMRDFNFVANMARTAPFQLTALSDSFVKLKTAGIDPTNGSMQALVDSVARFGGTGDTLKRATVAIQQMAGKGVISMEELRQQLGEAVPTAMQDMADAMGLSMAELAEKVSKGIVTAGPALEKMLLQMKIRNRGAAKEMMETWTGVTSQLETEWGLAAKAIADAGFGDGAKNAVRELIQMLRSDDFKRFGMEFGQVLGTITNGLVDVVKFFVAYREEIIMLGKAWLAYKVIFSGIIPLSEKLNELYQRKLPLMRRDAESLMETAKLRREDAIQSASFERYHQQAIADRLQRKLAADQRELQATRIKNNAVLFEDRQLRAQLEQQEKRAYVAGLNDSGKRDQQRARLKELAELNTQLKNREADLARQIDVTTGAHDRASRKAAEKAGEIHRLANASRGAQMAAQGAALATAAWGGALNLLGGPIGVIITAVMALVYWYDSARRAADDLAAAQRRAKAGLSEEGDEKKLAEALKKASADRDAAWNQYKRSTTMQGVAKSDEERALDLENFKRAQEAETQARLALSKAKVSLIDSASREEQRAIVSDMEQQLDRIKLAGQAKVNQLAKAFDDEKGELEKQPKKLAEARDKMTKAQQAADREMLKAQAAALEERARQLSGKATGMGDSAQRTAVIRAAEDFRKRAKDLREEAERDLKTASSAPVYQGGKGQDGDTDKSKNPLSEAIERVKEDNARLAAELAGLDETTGKVDNVFGAIAEVFQKWENGDYDITGKDGKTKTRPTRAQLDPLLQGVVDAENIKNRTKQLQEAAKDVARVSDFINGMEPDIQAAMELIADPLGTAARGPLEKRAEKFIGSNLKELKAYADEVGKTVDQVKAELVRGAVTADANNALAKLVQDTVQLEAQMVDDARDAARAKAEADNERHRQRVQNIIDMAALEGATIEQQQQWQNILGRDMAARAKALEKQFETPIQKLASNWANATENMREASASWANASMDFMVELVTKGKADFRSLVTSILADLARIQLQKAMSPWLDIGANLLMGAFGFGGATPASSAGSSISLTSGLNTGGLGLKAFANGGIMTEFGAAPLRKYAAGGVANSPQLALYGEGSMPEAYVPLPDGRTIPVTLKGAGQGGATDVQVNITVHQNGGESSSASGDSNKASAFKQMGERIKVVVREELANQSRPGGMLYR